MVSVCMATRNGERYLREQLQSILVQLKADDELIISDDGSTDGTSAIVESFADPRIRLIKNPCATGIVSNFQSSLRHSRGEFIFLADQDDVWADNKVSIMMEAFMTQSAELVISDCLVVDSELNPIKSFFDTNGSRPGLLKNLVRNSYMGCCMAFRRELLQRALPFPSDIPMHDLWIGLIAEMYFKVVFVPDKLVYHRRHGANASTTGLLTRSSMRKQFADRYRIVKNLIIHKTYA